MKVIGQLGITTSAVIELDENEMRVLEYIAGFGAKTVREHLGTRISEADLDRAFRDLQGKLHKTLTTVSRIREYAERGAPYLPLNTPLIEQEPTPQPAPGA